MEGAGKGNLRGKGCEREGLGKEVVWKGQRRAV